MNSAAWIQIGIAAGLSLVVAWYLWRVKLWRVDAFGKTTKQQRDVLGVPAGVWFVCGAMVYLVQPLAAQLALKLPPEILGERDTMQFRAVTTTSVYAGALGICVLLVFLLLPRLSERSGLRFRLSDLWVGAACLLLVAPVYVFIALGSQHVYELLSGNQPPKVAHETLDRIIKRRDDPMVYLLIFAVVVLAPIVEEFIYRVFLQSCMISLMTRIVDRGSTWIAIGITSTLFALSHAKVGSDAGPVPWVGIPGLFVLGLGMGIAYERTRRLGVPMVMHIGFNAANVLLALYR